LHRPSLVAAAAAVVVVDAVSCAIKSGGGKFIWWPRGLVL